MCFDESAELMDNSANIKHKLNSQGENQQKYMDL